MVRCSERWTHVFCQVYAVGRVAVVGQANERAAKAVVASARHYADLASANASRPLFGLGCQESVRELVPFFLALLTCFLVGSRVRVPRRPVQCQ
jgi:hypothetical protein